MRRAQIALVLTVVAFGAHANAENDASFESFKKLFNRVYATKEEEATRRAYFLQNMQRAAELKKRNPEAEFGMNVYSDLSANEFKRRHNAEAFYRRAASKPRSVKSAAEVKGDGADKSDWRKKGAVTAVKNQGDCGSCWSFSTTGNIEGQWQIAGNTLVSLSEQELVSCDTTCDGCNGGLMDDAFEWIVNSQGGGITSESSYPYVSGTGVVPACDMSGLTSYAYISGHQDVAHSESAMASWVSANGPLSVGVDASSWQTYQNGILSDCTSNQVDHGVLIVGFDLSAATPYWIIKNSWGPTWGEEGYIRVAYGSNQCLITTAPSSSIVSTGPQPPAPNPNPPPPDSGSGTFTQYTCSSLFCLSGCSSSTFSTGQCLSMSGGGSAIATCGASNLYLAVYTSSDCSGTSTTSEIPLDQCSQDTSGSYIYDTCSSGSASNSASSLGAEAQPSFVRLPLKKK